MKKLIAKASIQILKPVEIVFEAIVNPEVMTKFFIAESSGRLTEGESVIWKFPEFDERFPVVVKEILINELISFDWSGGVAGQLVTIRLSRFGDNFTIVKVEELEMDNNDEGIAWMMGQTEGWANFLSCLKAYLEYGINLRKGAFDYRFVN